MIEEKTIFEQKNYYQEQDAPVNGLLKQSIVSFAVERDRDRSFLKP